MNFIERSGYGSAARGRGALTGGDFVRCDMRRREESPSAESGGFILRERDGAITHWTKARTPEDWVERAVELGGARIDALRMHERIYYIQIAGRGHDGLVANVSGSVPGSLSLRAEAERFVADNRLLDAATDREWLNPIWTVFDRIELICAQCGARLWTDETHPWTPESRKPCAADARLGLHDYAPPRVAEGISLIRRELFGG